ncbi:hypothetical protein F8271_19330 [Micromonospora sp. ALFpr18c]|uniref:hypothetical protein n=1 Tax=unclassified Micromonospora TaxID=2617518 RepID=UPI00124B2A21|nr:hypothetical protein [Micromonospora sp. ALFpr18c]KAB1937332.1 hypothetical protein F8271_19330 [Micromonospora sp. ALFpr18c]
MNTTPTPEEAEGALRDVHRRRGQTAAAAGWPWWAWIVTGVLIAALGVLADRYPEFTRTYGTTIAILLLLVAMASNTRWGGALLRRPVRPRIQPDTSALMWSALILALLIGGTALAGALGVPHVLLWGGLFIGVLLAAAGPWWQRRVLIRAA